MKRISCILLGVVFLFLVCSCANVQKQPDALKKEDAPEVKETEEQPDSSRVVTHTEEEAKSLEVFMRILDIVEFTDDRKSVIPQVEDLYKEIIEDYPGAPLAQESYWKLISIYLNDYSPPEYDKAEARYQEFRKKYPDSVLTDMVNTTLADSYYRNMEWKRLLKLCAPLSEDRKKKESRPNASLLFKCAEADYNLGNTDDAVRNYRAVADLYPDSNIGKKAGLILDKIEKKSESD